MSRVPVSLPWRPVSDDTGKGSGACAGTAVCGVGVQCEVPRVWRAVRCACGHRSLPELLSSGAGCRPKLRQETLVGSSLAAGEFFEVCSAFCDVFGA